MAHIFLLDSADLEEEYTRERQQQVPMSEGWQ